MADITVDTIRTIFDTAYKDAGAKAAINDLGNYERAIKKVVAAFQPLDDADAIFKKAGFGITELGRGLTSVGNVVTAAFTVPMVAAGVASVKFASDFEAAMTKVTTLAGASKEEVEKLNDTVLKIAQETAQAPTELAKSLFVAESALFRGGKAAEIMEKSAKMAALGMGTAEENARALSSALLSYQGTGLTATEVADTFVKTVQLGNMKISELIPNLGRVIPLAAMFGISLGDVTASIATFSHLGVSVDRATSGLVQILSIISQDAPRAERGFRALNTSVDEFRHQIAEKGLTQAMVDLMNRAQSMPKGMQGFHEVFGNIRAFTEAMSNAGPQVQNYINITAQLAHAQGELAKQFAVTSETFKFRWNQLQVQLEILAIKFGTTLLPVMEKLIGFIGGTVVPIIDKMVQVWSKLPPVVQNVILVFGGMTAASGPFLIFTGQIILAIGHIMRAMVSLKEAGGIFGALGIAISRISSGLFSGINKGIPTLLAGIFSPGMDLIGDLTTKIGSALTSVAARITSDLGNALRVLVLSAQINLSRVLASFGITPSTTEAFVNGWRTTFAMVATLAVSTANFIKTTWMVVYGEMFAAVGVAAAPAFARLGAMFTGLFTAIQSNTIVQGAMMALSGAVNTVSTQVGLLAARFTTMGTTAVASSTTATGAVTALSTAVGTLAKVVSALAFAASVAGLAYLAYQGLSWIESWLEKSKTLVKLFLQYPAVFGRPDIKGISGAEADKLLAQRDSLNAAQKLKEEFEGQAKATKEAAQNLAELALSYQQAGKFKSGAPFLPDSTEFVRIAEMARGFAAQGIQLKGNLAILQAMVNLVDFQWKNSGAGAPKNPWADPLKTLDERAKALVTDAQTHSLEKLNTRARETALTLFKYGDSLEDVKKKLVEAGIASDQDEAAIRKLHQEYTKAAEAAVKMAKANEEIVMASGGFGTVLKTMKLEDRKKYEELIKSGMVSDETLQTKYKLTTAQIKALHLEIKMLVDIEELATGTSTSLDSALNKLGGRVVGMKDAYPIDFVGPLPTGKSRVRILVDDIEALKAQYGDGGWIDKIHKFEEQIGAPGEVPVGFLPGDSTIGRLLNFIKLQDEARKKFDDWARGIGKVSSAFANMAQIAGDSMSDIFRLIGKLFSTLDAIAKLVGEGGIMIQLFGKGGIVGKIFGERHAPYYGPPSDEYGPTIEQLKGLGLPKEGFFDGMFGMPTSAKGKKIFSGAMVGAGIIADLTANARTAAGVAVHDAAVGAQIGGMIGGPMGMAVGAAAGLVVGLIKGKPAWAKAADEVARDFGVKISDELAKSIANDAKSRFGGSRQASELFHLSDIIQEGGGLSPQNIGMYSQKLHDVFVMIGSGQMSIADGAKVVGQNWSAMAEAGTSKIGLLNANLVDTIRLTHQYGMDIKEVDAYVRQQLDNVFAGFEEFFTNTKIKSKEAGDALAGALLVSIQELQRQGMSMFDIFQKIEPWLKKMQQQLKALGFDGGAAFNEIMRAANMLRDPVTGPILRTIESFGKILAGLANTGLLTESTFMQLAGQIGKAIDQMIKKGKTFSDILVTTQPQLQMLWELQQRFGVQLDETTQRVIDQALAAGKIGEKFRSPTDRIVTQLEMMNQILVSIADKFGATIPAAIRRMIDEMNRANQRAGDAGGSGGGGGGNNGGGDNGSTHDWRGGFVGRFGVIKGPLMLNEGGKILRFTPRGTDTVPAMLTPGERVLSIGENRRYEELGRVLNFASAGSSMSDTERNVVHRHEYNVEFNNHGVLANEYGIKMLAREILKVLPQQVHFNEAGSFSGLRASTGQRS